MCSRPSDLKLSLPASNIAVREAEVARREAEILTGAPSGVIGIGPIPTSCLPRVAQATFDPPPVQTVIKEQLA